MAPRESLADPRIQAFLATREVVVLSTLEPDGAPFAMAMWCLPDPEALFMVSVADTRKVRNLRRDGRVAVLAESGTRAPHICGVSIQGRAEFLPDSPARRGLVARFLARYHPDLERLWGGRSMPDSRVMFRIVPHRVRSWGLGAS
jgi:PPOX class probable F420-dependent enzyme